MNGLTNLWTAASIANPQYKVVEYNDGRPHCQQTSKNWKGIQQTMKKEVTTNMVLMTFL